MDKSKNSVMTIIAIGIVIAAGLVVYNLISAPEYTTKHTALTHVTDSSSSYVSSENISDTSINEVSEPESTVNSAITEESSVQGSSASGNAISSTYSTAAPSSVSSEPNGPININTADFEELQEIKRIGPVLAQRIIDYRNLNGPFESWEELLEVKGIGEKTLEIIKQYACL